MGKLQTKENPFITELKRVLDLKEVKIDDEIITNKEAICQELIKKAINGDLTAIEVIGKLLNSK